MTPLTFPNLPTQDGIDVIYQNLGTFDTIKYLESLRVHITPPKKPSGIVRTGQEHREYANKLEVYEVEFAEYRNAQAECSIFNIKVDALINTFISEESGLNTIPEQYRNNVFSKAWSDGHSGGYYEVYRELCELVEIFN